jgi:hypothetical protein
MQARSVVAQYVAALRLIRFVAPGTIGHMRQRTVAVVIAAGVFLFAILDALATLVGLVDSSSFARVARALYPGWLLVIAAVALVGLFVWILFLRQNLAAERAHSASVRRERDEALRERVGADPRDEERRREHDKRILGEIREALPRTLVQDFLRDHDFGSGWPKEWMRRVTAFSHRNDVEDRFLDEELEGLRRDLHQAVGELRRLFGVETFPENAEWQNVGVSPRSPDHPDTALWERRRAALNDAATDAADSYDALIDKAREKALLL